MKNIMDEFGESLFYILVGTGMISCIAGIMKTAEFF